MPKRNGFESQFGHLSLYEHEKTFRRLLSHNQIFDGL